MVKKSKRARNNKLELSVVIPVFNGAATIGETLQALLDQCRPAEEIIVVDDGSTDNTKSVVREFPVKYISQENAGPATARNTGWRKAKGNIVAFTDSDCLPKKEWLRELIRPFDDPAVGAAGGVYQTANINSLLARLIGVEIDYRYSQMGKYIDVHGAYNLAVRRTILEKIDGFNENYSHPSGEDWDLCFRIIEKKYKIQFCPQAKVAGHHREKLGRYLKDQYRHGFYRMLLYRDYSRKLRGDTYTGGRVKYQVALGLGSLFLLLLALTVLPFSIPTGRMLLSLSAIFLVLILLTHLPLFFFALKRGIVNATLVVGLQIIRNLAWSVGAFHGGLVHGTLVAVTRGTIKSLFTDIGRLDNHAEK